MFTNLKTVLYQKGISLRQYAQFLGVSEKTIQNKLNGITDFVISSFKRAESTSTYCTHEMCQ